MTVPPAEWRGFEYALHGKRPHPARPSRQYEWVSSGGTNPLQEQAISGGRRANVASVGFPTRSLRDIWIRDMVNEADAIKANLKSHSQRSRPIEKVRRSQQGEARGKSRFPQLEWQSVTTRVRHMKVTL